jgi:arginine-tRNA-protein transferase
MAERTVRAYAAMGEQTAVDTMIVEYWKRGDDGSEQLVAAALTDRLNDGLSMVYSFFEPDAADRSLGAYMILDHIRRAQERALAYVYLGYLVEGSERMQYKVRYRPLERLNRGGWERMPEPVQKRLIAAATSPRAGRLCEPLPAKDGSQLEYKLAD